METAECYVAGWMGGQVGGEWTHVCVWLRPFGCSPETVTTLLTGHTPIQNNKKFKPTRENYKIHYLE